MFSTEGQNHLRKCFLGNAIYCKANAFYFLDMKQDMESSPYWACFREMQSSFHAVCMITFQ